MANALTAIRLVLAAPIGFAFAQPDWLAPSVPLILLFVAIATDYFDGPVARLTQTASARGQLFDHATDCLFVTAGLTGAALAGLVTSILPILIPIAFGQYVVDSYIWSRQKRLRASAIGRWNGVFYFAPLVIIVVARLPLAAGVASWLLVAAGAVGYVLVASTLVSMIDRGTAALRSS
jgi:phosphatidylglycerophosphate synthase